MRARRRKGGDLPAEVVRVLDAAGPPRVIPGLEGLAVPMRDHRAPAIPMPVGGPPKSKRGRRA